jgi:hypothetical protein
VTRHLPVDGDCGRDEQQGDQQFFSVDFEIHRPQKQFVG